MQKLVRFDLANMPRVKKSDDGFLRGHAFVTRTGVFKYINADGSARYELRHPDDILTQSHLDSLKLAPITNDHPSDMVTSANAPSLSKGMTGENITIEGQNIGVSVVITHEDAIADVEKGKCELSLGYTVDLIKEDGIYNGQAYTHRQTNPIVNHLAIVTRARAGAQARINMDGAAVQSPEDLSQEEVTMTTEANMAKVTLDSGLEYQAAPEVAKALDKLRADAQAHADELSGMQAKLDAAEEAKTEMQAKLDGEPARFAEAVKARIALVQAASKIAPDVNLDGTDIEIMTAAIKAVKPNVNLDGKSEAYIQARFDAAVEDALTPAQKQVAATQVKADGEQKDPKADAENAMKSMWMKKEASK